MPFLLNEDAAMEAKFQGLAVPTSRIPDTSGGSQPVEVIWRDPEAEITSLKFPCIVIENLGIERDPEREQRGFITFPYAPENLDQWEGWPDVTQSPYYGQSPIPYNINYRIEVLCRENSHALFLRAALAGPDFFYGDRMGFLNIPQDGTIRRIELVQRPQTFSGRDAEDKRLFSTIYTAIVSTEMLPPAIFSYNEVQSVGLDVIEITVPNTTD